MPRDMELNMQDSLDDLTYVQLKGLLEALSVSERSQDST
jgi:hypothetical protein